MIASLRRTACAMALASLTCFSLAAGAAGLTRAISTDDLFSMFLLNANSKQPAGWGIAAGTGSPITWITDGIAKNPDAHASIQSHRSGLLRVMLPGGELTDLHRTRQPAPWEATLAAASASSQGPDEVIIGNAGVECNDKCPNGGAYLATHRTKLVPVCTVDNGAGNGSHLYMLIQTGKKAALLRVMDNTGAMGHSQSWAIFWQGKPAFAAYVPSGNLHYTARESAQMRACLNAIALIPQAVPDIPHE